MSWKPVLLGSAFVFSLSCVGPMYRPEYEIAISTIAVSDDASFAEGTFAPLREHTDTSFRDDWLEADWAVSRSQLDVDLRNVAPLEVTLRWDLAQLTAVDGTTHKLTNCKLTLGMPAPGSPMASTRLLPSQGERHSLCSAQKYKPIDDPQAPAIAVIVPYLPGGATIDRDKAEAFALKQVGSSFKLELPAETANGSRLYQLSFVVKDYTIKRIIAG